MENEVLEQWRPVAGYEDLYEVSSLGNVKSVERMVATQNRWGVCQKRIKETILKAELSGKEGNEYLRVRLYKNGVGKHHLIHRLVAEAFIPNPCPEKYTIINHKIEGNEGRFINTVENLEWCDYDYNNNYGTFQERKAKALTNHPDLSKTVYQYTLAGELVKEWASTHEIHRQTGFDQSHISACCRNCYIREGNNVYKGYKWSYVSL